MTSPGAGPPQRRRLASALRGLRLGTGLSTTQLAERLGMSQSKVSRLELGRVTPTLDDVDAWTRATGATADVRSELLARVEPVGIEAMEWRNALRRGLPGLQVDLAELEASSGTISTYTPLLIPGLMQTPEYARRVLSARGMDSRADTAAAIGTRMERQRILYEDGRRLRFVVGETALRRRFGPPPVIREQLDRLLAVAELPTVTLGVLPLQADIDVWQTHGFNLFDDRSGEDPVVEVEFLTGALSITQPEDVEEYRRAFDRLLAVSVTGDAMVEIVRAAEGGPDGS